jgi:hypothetical protein
MTSTRWPPSIVRRRTSSDGALWSRVRSIQLPKLGRRRFAARSSTSSQTLRIGTIPSLANTSTQVARSPRRFHEVFRAVSSFESVSVRLSNAPPPAQFELQDALDDFKIYLSDTICLVRNLRQELLDFTTSDGRAESRACRFPGCLKKEMRKSFRSLHRAY